MHKMKKIVAALFVIAALLAMAIPAFAAGNGSAPAPDAAQTQQSESAQTDSSLGLKAVATGIAIGLAAAGGAVGMGIAVTFVMGLASAVCYVVNQFVLIKFGLEYMQTVTFILVIASLVQFIEMFLQKSMPSLYTALGIYLPLITTNCAVLGVVLLNVQNSYGFIESVVYGITGGLGFLLAIVLFASIRERLVFADYPKAFEGFPIALVTAGLMALAFMGFSGLKVW